jgi:sugar/nucleoside kinase (ribokinase family)
MTGRIVCLGDVMIDVLAVLPGPLAVGSDTPGQISLGHGGSAANTAAWLAFVGATSQFVGKVGDDAFGVEAVNILTAQGVSVSAAVAEAESTGTCIVLIGPDGERTMVPSAGANDTLVPQDLPAPLVGPDDHLHLSAYPLLRVGSRDAAVAALEQAVSVGASISVDAASADPLRAVGTDRFLSWLPAGTLLIANHHEAVVLTGCDDPRTAASRLASRFRAVVVKCGRHGAVLATSDVVEQVRGGPVEVVDSTGAGDAFAAGLLAALTSGERLTDAVAGGNALGAQAVSHIGARPLSGMRN